MNKTVFYLALCVFLLSAFVLHAAVDIEVFNESFTRGTGEPVTVLRSFPGASGPATIYLYNGDAEDSTIEKVSSSVITVDGVTIFDASNFNQNINTLTKTVMLTDRESTISVLLKSKPGGTIRIKVVQTLEAPAATKTTTLLLADALKTANTQKALSYIEPIAQAKYQAVFEELGTVGLQELGFVIATATPVFIGQRYAEYEGVVVFSNGDRVIGKFMLIKTSAGWKFTQL